MVGMNSVNEPKTAGSYLEMSEKNPLNELLTPYIIRALR
jgi:hypothetical protein